MPRALDAAQAVAAAAVLARLARGRRRVAPLEPRPTTRTVSVVIPARDEADRIGPCLDGLTDVDEVIVVDDQSSDGTADMARAHGGRVIAGAPLPDGWFGKPWAMQQGVEAATGEVVVCLDADTRPRPGLAGALDAALRDADLVTAGARFTCDTAGERFLHPSFLASVVYRFGPLDVDGPAPPPDRVVSNGQCTAVLREKLLAAGGYRDRSSSMADDFALARSLAHQGWRVAFRDAANLLDVDMHASGREVWEQWGRSIAAADVTPRGWQVADALTIWLTMALPVLRLGHRPLDRLLLAVRFALLAGLKRTYATRGAPFWLSPLADPLTAVRITLSTIRPPTRWRDRDYG